MNCLIENDYIKGTFQKKHMYSQMNCLIENDYIKGTFQKKKITHVFPNELPNWKRLHKGNFQKKTKNTYVFPNELPNWKRILKGKNGKTREKSWRTLLRGGFIIVNRELAYFIAGGVINAMWTLYLEYWLVF